MKYYSILAVTHIFRLIRFILFTASTSMWATAQSATIASEADADTHLKELLSWRLEIQYSPGERVKMIELGKRLPVYMAETASRMRQTNSVVAACCFLAGLQIKIYAQNQILSNAGYRDDAVFAVNLLKQAALKSHPITGFMVTHFSELYGLPLDKASIVQLNRNAARHGDIQFLARISSHRAEPMDVEAYSIRIVYSYLITAMRGEPFDLDDTLKAAIQAREEMSPIEVALAEKEANLILRRVDMREVRIFSAFWPYLNDQEQAEIQQVDRK